MAFARWDPFHDLISIQYRLDRLSAGGPQGWAPAVDLSETATTFIFTAELPGLTRDHVKIEIHDDHLTIQGRREARVPCEQYHQVERGHGEFCRTFALPQAVDAAAIAADLTDGVLTVTVPKTMAAGAQRVPVS